MVSLPEDYRWNSIGYHIQSGNRDDFLYLEYGLLKSRVKRKNGRLNHYRRFLYKTVVMNKDRCNSIDKDILTKEQENDFELSHFRRFSYRTRYFTDAGIIGGKAFVMERNDKVSRIFRAKRNKKPKPISGLTGIYSLKRLTE